MLHESCRCGAQMFSHIVCSSLVVCYATHVSCRPCTVQRTLSLTSFSDTASVGIIRSTSSNHLKPPYTDRQTTSNHHIPTDRHAAVLQNGDNKRTSLHAPLRPSLYCCCCQYITACLPALTHSAIGRRAVQIHEENVLVRWNVVCVTQHDQQTSRYDVVSTLRHT
jgi:hypothetical protein